MQIYSYGLQPYYGYSNQDVVELIRTHQLLTCPVGCPPRLYALLVDCWQRVPSTRPYFDTVRHRLRYCAVDGSGSASGGSATPAGCCGTDGAYQPYTFCPPAACLQHEDAPSAQVYAGPHVERCNVSCLRPEDISVPPVTSCQDDAHRWPLTVNGNAVVVGTAAGTTPDAGLVSRSRQPSSAVGCSRQCPAVNRSTTSTSASTPRNSHHLARSSSSSASDPKSRRVTSSELDRLTSHPRPR